MKVKKPLPKKEPPDNTSWVKIKKAPIFSGRTVRARVPRLDAVIRYIAGQGKLGEQHLEVEALFVRTGPNTYRQLDSTEASKLYLWLKDHPNVTHQSMTLTQVEEALR
jgi:hypothetical protein